MDIHPFLLLKLFMYVQVLTIIYGDIKILKMYTFEWYETFIQQSTKVQTIQ